MLFLPLVCICSLVGFLLLLWLIILRPLPTPLLLSLYLSWLLPFLLFMGCYSFIKHSTRYLFKIIKHQFLVLEDADETLLVRLRSVLFCWLLFFIPSCIYCMCWHVYVYSQSNVLVMEAIKSIDYECYFIIFTSSSWLQDIPQPLDNIWNCPAFQDLKKNDDYVSVYLQKANALFDTCVNQHVTLDIASITSSEPYIGTDQLHVDDGKGALLSLIFHILKFTHPNVHLSYLISYTSRTIKSLYYLIKSSY